MEKTTDQSGLLFVISAPSGTGKTSAAKGLLQQIKGDIQLKQTITYTTRPPRWQEKKGDDYHFVSPTEFLEKKAQGFFFEEVRYNDHYYGTPQDAFTQLDHGISLLMVIDYRGAKKIKEKFSSATLIWLEPPSLSALEMRLTARKTESDTQIAQRLSLAKQEIHMAQSEQLFDHCVVNHDLQDTIDGLEKLVRERHRQAR